MRIAWNSPDLLNSRRRCRHCSRQDGPIFATLHIEKGALSPEFNYRVLDDPKKRDDFRAALRA